MCYRPPQAEVEAMKNAAPKTRECPECGAECPRTSKTCPKCGAKLPPMKLNHAHGPAGPKGPSAPAPAAPGAPKPPAPGAPAGPNA